MTVIDSCHSGDVTRYIPDEEDDIQTRQSPGREGPRPLDSYIFHTDPAAQDWLQDFRKNAGGDAYGAVRLS
ncbi:MAG: hypothetical protein R3E95_17925 [Thiolinea sp.]